MVVENRIYRRILAGLNQDPDVSNKRTILLNYNIFRLLLDMHILGLKGQTSQEEATG